MIISCGVLLVPFVLRHLRPLRRHRAASSITIRWIDDIDQRGVVLPYSAPLALCYLATLLVVALFCLALPAISWANGIPDHDLTAANALMVVLTLLLPGYALWCLIELARGGLTRGVVALTPQGVYHRSWVTAGYLPWADVLGIVAVANPPTTPLVRVNGSANNSGWRRRTSRVLRATELDSAPHLTVAGNFLAPDPALLYHAANYYHQNPAARPELADERGLARLREGRVTAGFE